MVIAAQCATGFGSGAQSALPSPEYTCSAGSTGSELDLRIQQPSKNILIVPSFRNCFVPSNIGDFSDVSMLQQLQVKLTFSLLGHKILLPQIRLKLY